MNSTASRLPSVIVPVLSSSSTSQSPEASTARPERASTLRRTSRSMPAIPIAESSAPIVVGISATSRAISVVSESSVPAKRANGRSETTTMTKTRVSAASRIPSAISFGVLRRSAPSTRAIIRSRKDLPGSWVISTTIRSESTLVPPVTARAVAAGLADHRRRLAGDRRLVDRGDALDHGAVAGDRLARLDHDDVAADQLGGRLLAAVAQAARWSRCASPAGSPPGRGRGPRPAPRRGWRRRP